MLLCLGGRLSSSSGPFTRTELCRGPGQASEKVRPRSEVHVLGTGGVAREGEFWQRSGGGWVATLRQTLLEARVVVKFGFTPSCAPYRLHT